MKIALWPTQYVPNIGGLEVLTHALASELKRQGHSIQVIASSRLPNEFKTYTIDGIDVATFPLVSALASKNLKEIKESIEQIGALLDHFSPDVVHLHGWLECFAFYQWRVLSGRPFPYWITIHGLLEQPHYRTPACTALWDGASGINTVSRFLLNALAEAGLSHPRLSAIHNGLPLPPGPPAPLPFSPPRLLMIGRLSLEKGFDCALQALQIVRKTRSDVRLQIAGGGDAYWLIEAERRALGLEDACEMTDFVPPPKIGEAIDRATLLLVPSTYEAFGLVALEGALRGRPVIASRVGGLPEIVEEGKTGLLVPPHHPVALAEAILFLLERPQLARSMGEEASRRARATFSIEETARRYVSRYNEVHAQVGSGPERKLPQVDDGVVASQDLPLVSVVIPVYNGAAYLAQAIESVRAQRYPRYEILVIDNGSEDATREVARRFPDVRYHALPLTGDTALARNQGVELAEGDYIAFLDQDDVWTAGKLHAQIAFLLAHPTYAGVVGYQQMVLEPGHAKPHWLKQQFLEAPQMGYLPSALLVRRSAFADISLFDPSFPLASDVAWFFRAKHRNLPIHMLDQVVVERRIHNDNASHRCAQIHKELLAVIRSSLTERRGGVVSVILPVWNGENYLKEAVESILAQDYPRLEIVIVDDGSTDGTAPLIRSFGSKVRPLFLPENRGLGASRNAGIRIASGDYFAFLDHDDLWSPAKLSSQLRLLQERPDDPLVFCQAQQFLCPTLSDSERAELIVDESATTAYFAGTLLLSRKRLFEVGLFLEEKVLGEFVDWYLRALEKKVPIALLQEVGLYRRVHRHNMGRQKEHYHRTDYLKILKASLDRRRAAAEPRSV